MDSRIARKLLIYHLDSKIYGKILAERLPHLEIHSAAHPEEAFEFAKGAEIILSWQIPDELLKEAKHLCWFSSIAAGNEDLFKNPCLPESVTLTKATVYGEMMAEYVFAYILYFSRNVPKYLRDQGEGVWDPARPERLRGKTLGILGLGSVGKEIARRGKQFGMRVLGVKRTPEPVKDVDQVYGPRDLEKMIPSVDILVVVLPLTPGTDRLLGEKEINLMKEGALFFNIGRGKVVDEVGLANVLKSGKIKAVLDTFEKEPLPRESELWGLENVIITPHVSGINIPEEICAEFVKNYERWIRGDPLIGLVDREKGY
jgi:phosphoglycerate dehydrogenase-like enzyme